MNRKTQTSPFILSPCFSGRPFAGQWGFNVMHSFQNAVSVISQPVQPGSPFSWQSYIFGSNRSNGTIVGTSSAKYTSNSSTSGQVVSCVLKSDVFYTATTIATSKTITISATSSLVPSVVIAASGKTIIYAGSALTFNAAPRHGGHKGGIRLED